jgi:GNAT superfamily N-acetyltransferase
VVASIRRAEIDDVPVLRGLVQEYWRFEQIAGFDAESVARSLRMLLQDPRLGAGWLALIDGEVVGYLLAVYVFSLENHGLTTEIDELYIAGSHRGSGIGSLLLTEAEGYLAAQGCGLVALRLGKDNDRGRAFYARHGYTQRPGFDLLEKNLCRVV